MLIGMPRACESRSISGKTETRKQKQKRYTYLVISKHELKAQHKDFDVH